MELYDKKYVYFDWDDELEGKKGFFADSINDLKRNVNNNNSWFGEIHKCTDDSFPFEFIDDSYIFYPFKFCYYDPFYEFRKAYLEGKQIQFLDNGNWEDVIGEPLFTNDRYRIKPEWYIVLDDYGVSRTSELYENETVLFEGTEEECIEWMEKYKQFEKIMIAWKQDKTIQYKEDDEWKDWLLSDIPRKGAFDAWKEWRIKDETKSAPFGFYQSTEPRYYLSVNKNDYLEFTISQNITDKTIYIGTRKECERMMKIIGDEFEEEDISHRDISYRLRCIINKYSHEKYKRRMTNRELSEYLAKGNGEMKKLEYFINTSTFYCYKNNTENENVDDNILIRDFGSDEWRPPLIEV